MDKKIFEAAHAAWERLAPLRARRRRYRRFTYGDQWGDPVADRGDLAQGRPAGRLISEKEAASRSGREPLTNNLIRRMVKAIIGRYRMEAASRSDILREVDPADINRLEELDSRTLEEFLISGMAIHRVCRETRANGAGAWVDNISPDRFFINDTRDIRGCDIELCGCLHDLSLGEVLMRYSFGSRRKANAIRKIYSECAASIPPSMSVAADGGDVSSFTYASAGRCRVIEVWTLECREQLRIHDPLTASMRLLDAAREDDLRRLNNRRRRRRLPAVASRWEVATVWHCRIFAPDGALLDSYDSPLATGALPFAIKLYPLLGGEVHSLVEDVIDQQKYVNRLISLLDHIMGTSAKGVLLFPTTCLPEKMDLGKIASAWAEPGGIILYNPHEGESPRQVNASPVNIGAREMLQTQIQLFEDISGVSASLMGQSVSGAVGAQRYESELRNSAISILDLLSTYADFTTRRNQLLKIC